MRHFLCILAATAALAQTDTSAHTARRVAVEPGVEVEVLDWGGTGRPLVLLAGYLTAHAYDDFAPQLTASFHVYGITRRGYGASSKPESGYSAQRSAADVVGVLDALKLERPILAGHSWGGQDLSNIGADFPARAAALIYLNSVEDPTLTFPPPPGALDKLPEAMKRPPQPDRSSVQKFRETNRALTGIAFPVGEIVNLFEIAPDGSIGKARTANAIRQAIFEGRAKPRYSAIKAPVLAFFSEARLEDQMAKFPHASAEEKEAIRRHHEGGKMIGEKHKADLVAGVPGAKIIDVPGGNFYIFLSHPELLAREIGQFVRTLP